MPIQPIVGRRAELRPRPVIRVLPSKSSEMQALIVEIVAQLRRHDYSDGELFGIRLSLDEALTNAVRHGNHGDENKRVTVEYAVSPDRVSVRIHDQGEGFNVDEVPDPTLPENIGRPCGRGVMLMRHYMTHIHYIHPGNCVEMVFEH